MGNYILSCCSTADLSKEHFEARNIHYICFHYTINGRQMPDDLGQSMPFDKFYAAMAAGAETSTSQINADEFIEYFTPFLAAGQDVVHVTLSSGISGVINSANLAKQHLEEKFPGRKVYVVDSLGASSGYGLIMDTLADLRDGGMDAPELAAGALTIANEGGTMKHMAVVAEHPELNVTLASNYPQTMEELTTAMVSGTGSIDVFSLNTDANPVARLIDKGYAADLSGYPELMAVAGRMDARFTESVMRDGKLYGLPVSLYTSGMGVNADTMEKLGLTQDDLPTTWLEFLDFAANFYYDYGEENADVALMDLNMRRPLFQMICKQYVAAQLRDTGSISFDTPLFRKLMQALEAIDFTELDPYEVKGDKVWEGDDANEFYEKQQLFTSYAEATPRSMGQSGYGSVNQPLILSLDGETEPIVPVSMTVMIVNPRSTRIDQAAAYLTAYAGHYEAETENIMFFPDQNDPVPNRYYEVQKQSYEESLQDLDSRIEKADESEKASLRDNREQIQGFLDELENQRMSVTEEMIQAYREQVAPYLYVTPQTPLTNSDSSGELGTLTSQYLDHAIDLDTYIREMDQRVRMMMLEDM